MRALRFDDKTKRKRKPNGRWEDKLVHIREVIEIMTRNIENLYTPGEFLTADEILVNYRGRCSFIIYIPSKKHKYGIKIFCLVDPQTMYLVNFIIYTGKSNDEGDKNLGETVSISKI